MGLVHHVPAAEPPAAVARLEAGAERLENGLIRIDYDLRQGIWSVFDMKLGRVIIAAASTHLNGLPC